MMITASALAADQYDFALTVCEHIGNHVAVYALDNRTDGNLYFDIGTLLTVAILSAAVFAVTRAKMLLVMKSVERVFGMSGYEYYVSALAAVSAVRSAVGHVFFRMQAGGAVSAVTRLDIYLYFVDKHNPSFIFRTAFSPSATASATSLPPLASPPKYTLPYCQ